MPTVATTEIVAYLRETGLLGALIGAPALEGAAPTAPAPRSAPSPPTPKQRRETLPGHGVPERRPAFGAPC